MLEMRSKSLIVAIFLAVSLLSGAIDQYFYPGDMWPPTALAPAVLNIFLVFLWYRIDSTEIGYKRSPWLNLAVVALALVALPYYFFRSRGAKRGAIYTGLMIAVLITSGILSAVGMYATYYGLQV
jgi:hypothetical protein